MAVIHKLVPDREFKAPCWIEDLGNYNSLPSPAIEISIQEMLHALIWCPSHYEFRQIMIDNVFRDVQILWFWDQAIAIARPIKWSCKEGRVVYDLHDVRFWRVGCQHRWQEQSTGEVHWHRKLCTKCDLVWEYDSSG